MTGRGGKPQPLLLTPPGGWTHWPSGDPNLTITLTSIPPPTSKFNPNTSLRPSCSPQPCGPARASEAHMRQDPAPGATRGKTTKSHSLIKSTCSLFFFSSLIHYQMYIFRHSGKKRRKKEDTEDTGTGPQPTIHCISPREPLLQNLKFVRHEIRLSYKPGKFQLLLKRLFLGKIIRQIIKI